MRSEARTIIRIYDRNRNAWTENPPAVTPVLSPATAFVTTRMLKDVMVYGTAKSLKAFSQERPSAGKTGTTDDYRDAWFIGYTPQVITGIWVGYDKPRPGGKGFTGGSVCAPLWERFMRPALAARPVVDFVETGYGRCRFHRPDDRLPGDDRLSGKVGRVLYRGDRADRELSQARRNPPHSDPSTSASASPRRMQSGRNRWRSSIKPALFTSPPHS